MERALLIGNEMVRLPLCDSSVDLLLLLLHFSFFALLFIGFEF